MKRFLLNILVLLSINIYSQDLSQNDIDTLIALYNSTDGENWTNKWDLSADPTTWYGVVTAVYFPGSGGPGQREIDEINLPNNNLSGELPDELGNLVSLNTLNLSSNNITGEIPSALGNAEDLNYLYLQNNELSGDIPVELFSLNERHFVEINLSNNQLTGKLPEEIDGSIANVGRVYVSNNLLTDLPDYTFISLFRIETLDISSNNIPFSVFERADFPLDNIAEILEENVNTLSYSPQNKINSIEELSVIEGENISFSVTGLTSVNNTYQWYLDNAMISGATNATYEITDAEATDEGVYFCEISNTNVPNLTLQRNNINLDVTLPISDRDALIALYNATDGANWRNPWDLNADMNTWIGVTLNENNRVVGLNLSNNNLSGEFPGEIWSLTKLQSLDLNLNSDLTGSISSAIGNLNELELLRLTNTRLGGIFPSEIFSLTSLETLEINNQFEGSLSGIENLINLKDFISDGSNFDSVPEGFWSISSLEEVSITSSVNQISFSIPATINELTSLERLRISGTSNNPIPNEITELTNLLSLSIGGEISGNIPEDIGNLVNLDVLSLEGNFEGEIPESIVDLVNLRILSLQRNNLTGEIPRGIGNLTKLESIFLFENDLTGTIPESIGQLTKLDTFWLSDNNISGVIPTQIGNCELLESLSLDRNNLEGTIPEGLASISTLSSLVLENNSLSGEVPDFTGTNLNTLFIGDNSFVFEDLAPNQAKNLSHISRLYSFSPQSFVDSVEAITVNEGDDITLTVEGTQDVNNVYQWRKGFFEDIDGATERTFTIRNAMLSDANEYDCFITNSSVADLVLVKNKITLDISTLGVNGFDFEDAGIIASPVPVNDQLFLSLGSISGENVTAYIYEISGQLLFVEENIKDNQSIDFSNLPSGMYLIKLDSSGKTYTKKIVKK